MTLNAFSRSLAVMVLTFSAQAAEDERSYTSASAAYRCGSDASMTLIATRMDGATTSITDENGYRHARLGRQTFRCEGGPSATIVVDPPRDKGECGADGRVIITDISLAGQPRSNALIEFNKECVFSDFITTLKITRSPAGYSVERCSVKNRFNPEAFVGCSTTVTPIP